MSISLKRTWFCPLCKGQGMLTGESSGGRSWAECLNDECGQTQPWEPVHAAQERLKMAAAGLVMVDPAHEPAMD